MTSFSKSSKARLSGSRARERSVRLISFTSGTFTLSRCLSRFVLTVSR